VADFLEFLRERVPGLWTPQEVFTPPPMPEPASTPIVPANYDIDLFHQRPVPKQYQPGHDRWSFWQEEMAKSEEALRQGDQFGQVQHSGGAAPGALGAALTAENEVVSQGTLGGYVYKVAKTKGTPLEGFVRGSGGMMDQVNPVSRALGISTEDIYNRADEIVAAYESAPYGKEQMAWDTFRRGMVPVQAGLAETLFSPSSYIGFGIPAKIGAGISMRAGKAAAESGMMRAMIREAPQALDRIAPEIARAERTSKLYRGLQLGTLPAQAVDRLADIVGPYAFWGMLGAMGTAAGLERLQPEGVDPGLVLTGGTVAGALAPKAGKLPIFRQSAETAAKILESRLRNALNSLARSTGEAEPVETMDRVIGAPGVVPVEQAATTPVAAGTTPITGTAPAVPPLEQIARMTKTEASQFLGRRAALKIEAGKPYVVVHDVTDPLVNERVRLDEQGEKEVQAALNLDPKMRYSAYRKIVDEFIDRSGKRGLWTAYDDIHREAVSKNLTALIQDALDERTSPQRVMEIAKSAGMRIPNDQYKLLAAKIKQTERQYKQGENAVIGAINAELKTPVPAAMDSSRADAGFDQLRSVMDRMQANQLQRGQDAGARLRAILSDPETPPPVIDKGPELSDVPDYLGQQRVFKGKVATMHPLDEAAFLATVPGKRNKAAAQWFRDMTGATDTELQVHGARLRNALSGAKGGEVELPYQWKGAVTPRLKPEDVKAALAENPATVDAALMNREDEVIRSSVESIARDLSPEEQSGFDGLIEQINQYQREALATARDDTREWLRDMPEKATPELRDKLKELGLTYGKVTGEQLGTFERSKKRVKDFQGLLTAYREGKARAAQWRREQKARLLEQFRKGEELSFEPYQPRANAAQAAQAAQAVQEPASPSLQVQTGITDSKKPPIVPAASEKPVTDLDREYFSRFSDAEGVAEDAVKMALAGDWSGIHALWRASHPSPARPLKKGETVENFDHKAMMSEWFAQRARIKKASGGEVSGVTPRKLQDDPEALMEYARGLAETAARRGDVPWKKGPKEPPAATPARVEPEPPTKPPASDQMPDAPATLADLIPEGGLRQLSDLYQDAKRAGLVQDEDEFRALLARDSLIRTGTGTSSKGAKGLRNRELSANGSDSYAERRPAEADQVPVPREEVSNVETPDPTSVEGGADELRRPVDQPEAITEGKEVESGTPAARTAAKEGTDAGGTEGTGTESEGPLEGAQQGAVSGVPEGRRSGQAGAGDGEQGASVREETGGAGVQRGRSSERGDEGRGVSDSEVAHVSTTSDTSVRDHIITDDDPVGARKGARELWDDNVESIKLLKTLQKESRKATPEEQAILARFRGWGASKLNKYFEPWSKEYKALSEILGEDEMRALEKSRTNAHYTSPDVVKAIWKALDRLGIGSLPRVRMLEPSAGSGFFLGLQPTHLAARSARTAIELDKGTGGILEQLYQNARVFVQGYQDTPLRPNEFDLIVSNVPFSETGFTRREWMKGGKQWLNKLGLHNQFFALALEQVRPGGVIAFITSRYTMDGQGAKALRKYLTDEADFLGAVRLPRNTFKDVADTEVVTDVVFLRKRLPGEALSKGSTGWLETRKMVLGQRSVGKHYWNQTKEDVTTTINRYWDEHPEMVVGKPSNKGSMYSEFEYTVDYEGDDLVKAIDDAFSKLPEGVIKPWERPAGEAKLPTVIKGIRKGSYYSKGNKVYRDGELVQKNADRIADAIKVRDIARRVLSYQLEGATDVALKAAQGELRKAHAQFVGKWGPLNSTFNRSALRSDPDSHLLRALENWDKTNQAALGGQWSAIKKNVTDSMIERLQMPIFNSRVVKALRQVERAERADDALAITLNDVGRVDFDHMAKLTGKSTAELERDLKGRVYLNPEGDWETADEYLTGYVKDKLRAAKVAAEKDTRYRENVEALGKVQPADLEPSQIEVRMSGHWLPPDVMSSFARDLLGVRNVTFRYVASTSEWMAETNPKHWGVDWATSRNKWGIDQYSAEEIFMALLNHKRPKVYDTVDDKLVLNSEKTLAAQEKAEAMETRFREWAWEDPTRAKKLSDIYNERFNDYVPRSFNGDHLDLVGANPAIKLRDHQKAAIWRILQSGNTLLAHAVGAGKTFVMAGAAMEMRRMGLSKKNLFIVPNHLVQQFADDFRKLYPSASLLVPTKAEFERTSRNGLFSRIATGDWDGVIIAQSQMTLMPMRPGAMETHIRKELDELRASLWEMKREGASQSSQKQIQRAIDRLEKKLDEKLKKLAERQDETGALYFEDLGLDTLFVDEADMYKNLLFTTKMERIKGLSNTDSERAMDMFLKTQFVSKRNGGRGVVFATGTPISNTIAELWTMMRYLMPDTLEGKGVGRFDSWASQYAMSETTLEQTVSGAYKPTERFSKFINAPELSKLFQHVADIMTDEDLKLPKPKLVGGKPEVISSSPDDALLDYMKDIAERIDALRGGVPPEEDNMLKISSDARKAALDMRLVDPKAPENPNGKLNRCATKVAEIYHATVDTGNPTTDRSTQLVFLDLGTPKAADDTASRPKKKAEVSAEDEFGEELVDQAAEARDALTGEEVKLLTDVYSALKQKLEALGVKTDEIAFIHEYDTPAKKKRLFDAVNNGDIRVLIGSTYKMGPGMNVQERLRALHHLDAPWRPRDIEQREGRILRQGNSWEEAQIFEYVTEKSFDGYIWQALYSKAKAIKSMMRRSVTDRTIVDNDDLVLSAAEARAIATGNPLVFRKAEIEAELAKLKMRHSTWFDEQQRAKMESISIPDRIKGAEGRIEQYRNDVALRDKSEGAKFSIEIQGKAYTDKAAAAKALKSVLPLSEKGNLIEGGEWRVGTYRGFPVRIKGYGISGNLDMSLLGNGTYETSFFEPANIEPGTFVRLDNALKKIDDRISYEQRTISRYEREMEVYKGQIGKPFEDRGKIASLESELGELLAKLTGSQQGIVSPTYRMIDQAWTAITSQGVKKGKESMEALREGVHTALPTVADEDVDLLMKHWDVIKKVHTSVQKDRKALTEELDRLAEKGLIERDRDLTMGDAFARIKALSQTGETNWKSWKSMAERYKAAGDLLLDQPYTLTGELIGGPLREKMGVGKGFRLPHAWATRPLIGAALGAMLNPEDPTSGAMLLGFAGMTTHPKAQALFKNVALASGRYVVANAIDALLVRNPAHGISPHLGSLVGKLRGKETVLDRMEKRIGPAPVEVSRQRMQGVREGQLVSKHEIEQGIGGSIPIQYRVGAGLAAGALSPTSEEDRPKAMVAGAAIGAGFPRWSALTRRVAAATESTARTAAWGKAKGEYLTKEYPDFRSRLLKSLNGSMDGQAKTRVAAVLDGEEGQFTSDWLLKRLKELGVSEDTAKRAAKDWANVSKVGDEKGAEFAGHIQFDYNYTKADEFLKHFVPFHFYATRNLPWYAEHMAKHPVIASAVLQMNRASEEERAELGLTQRFLGMFVLGGGIGQIASELVGRKGKIAVDPLAATISVMSQVRDPMEWGGETQLGEAMGAAQQVGISPYPAYQAAIQMTGQTGTKPAPSFVPLSSYAKDVAGVDVEKPLRELGAKVQGQRLGAKVDPEAAKSSRIRTRIAEMATEDGKPGAYDKYMDDPNSEAYRRAKRDVERESAVTSAATFVLPTRAKFLSETEERVRRTRAEHYPKAEVQGDEAELTPEQREQYKVAAEEYPEGTTYSGTYQSPDKRALSVKMKEFMALGSKEENEAYSAETVARTVPEDIRSIIDGDKGPRREAMADKVGQARQEFLSRPENTDFAAFWRRNSEEARKGNQDYSLDDYLKEVGRPTGSFELQKEQGPGGAIVEEQNKMLASAKYTLQKDLREYYENRNKNWMAMGAPGGMSRVRADFLADRPMLAMYFAWRQRKGYPNTEEDNMGHVDAFLKEREGELQSRR